jgi:hypothetical protein
MRSLLLTATTVLVFGVALLFRAAEQDRDTVKVRLRLVDEKTGKGIPGVVRVCRQGEDKPLALDGLLHRLRGLKDAEALHWYVVPADGAETTLPRTALRLEAFSGLETTLARHEVDLGKGDVKEVTVKLTFLFRPEEKRLFAGNTHLHLRNLTREQADDYLRQVPAADGLKVLFISYLERAKDDREYITNQYPLGPLQGFDNTGVLLGNGEEHRHNFEAYGQGYGHVMFLGINRLVQPVSLGPGITDKGDDDRALRDGIDDARKQGGTVIWCHNHMGYEAAPSALAGRLHALNVYDGTRQGTYEERYYLFLNVGLRLSLTTGTDWFLYDFERVYARIPGNLTLASWLEALRAGRCTATNGPLLTLAVDGHEAGDVLNFDKPRTVRIEATGLGRHDFESLQLIRNGKVLATQKVEKTDGGYTARLVREVRIDEPAWFAVRIESTKKNELGHQLFAHSSPVHVDLAGKGVLDPEAVQTLQRQLGAAREAITQRGRFSTPAARDRVLALYSQAEKDLLERARERGR